LLPRQKRWATFALYGFCRHVDNLIDVPRDRTAKEILNELDYLESEINTGYRTGESEHPIVRPFIAVVKHYAIPKHLPLELLKGVKMDLNKNRYKNFDELYLFAYRVAGVVGLMMTPVLGFKDPKALDFAEKLGVAMQLTNIIRDVKEDKEMGRLYLPIDELKQHNLTTRHIFAEHLSPEFKKFMKFQIDRAHHYFEEGDKGIKLLDRDAQFAILSASRIYRNILTKVELQNYNPFLGRVFVPQKEKVRILAGQVLKTRILPFAFNETG
jgi:phytoene synthase